LFPVPTSQTAVPANFLQPIAFQPGSSGMKPINHSPVSLRGAIVTMAAAAIAITMSAADIKSHGGYVDLGQFTPAASGGEFVEVNVPRNLISMASKLVGKDEPEVSKILEGLQSIRVNVVSVDDSNREELTERIARIRDHVTSNGWQQVVSVRDGDETVGVYVKALNDEVIEGITITVIDGSNEAVFVNIVGDVRPEQIATLGERFGIDPLKEIASHNRSY
jgi:hypothetical protein